ncbi:hypothetical protein H5T55_00875 [Candidatus Bipolaricaulota bacterium]|nr:hypothetical protein [Candidatus Bipolaricaulota bacterium]
MIVPWVGILGVWIAAWGGLGFPFVPAWWASLLVPAVWSWGLVGRKRGCLTLGLFLSVGLAAGAAFAGALIPALAAVSLALWSWDLGLLWISRLQRGEPKTARRLARAALLRSTALGAAGIAAGVGFTSLPVPLPFWGLVGGATALWLGLVLVVRGIGRAYRPGEASGNRSSSAPIR